VSEDKTASDHAVAGIVVASPNLQGKEPRQGPKASLQRSAISRRRAERERRHNRARFISSPGKGVPPRPKGFTSAQRDFTQWG